MNQSIERTRERMILTICIQLKLQNSIVFMQLIDVILTKIPSITHNFLKLILFCFMSKKLDLIKIIISNIFIKSRKCMIKFRRVKLFPCI